MSPDNPQFVCLFPFIEKGYSLEPEYVAKKWIAGHYCPKCGKKGNWRSGVHFEHEMRCFNGCEPAPKWEPGEVYFLVSRRPQDKRA